VCVSACCLQSATVILREAMSVEEFLASACSRKNLNPMEHFLRVKKRKDMEDHNYFVPHRTDLVETYVSTTLETAFSPILFSAQSFLPILFFPSLYTLSYRSSAITLCSAKFHFATATQTASPTQFCCLLYTYKPAAQNVVIVVVVNIDVCGFAKVLARLTHAD